ALAARTTVLPCFLCSGRAVGGSRYGWRRRIATGLAEILMPTAATMLLALVALAGFARGRRRAVVVRVMALTMAFGARPALFRTAAGTPDFNQFRLRGRCRRRLGSNGLFGAGGGFARGDGRCRRLSGCFDGLIRRSLNGFRLGRRFFGGTNGLRRSLSGGCFADGPGR